ncbi:MAG: imidazoleglycerol-phosphate dehydratase HisB [Oscillospiraceae bacterium]|nr:imidazoleglycerol-phosphate dehydratase HisB [Oscillospiraceae bacterium]
MRTADISRKTKETSVEAALNIDGSGIYKLNTGIGFLDHMLELFAYNGCFDLELRCGGDLKVDNHHSAEDCGIVLGSAFDQALGGRGGITRYGQCVMPMDEALVMTAIDISGRPWLEFNISTPERGALDIEAIEEFLHGFVRSARLALHINMLSGRNAHHILEACFKGFGRALAAAVMTDARRAGEVPSSKGIL